MSLVFSHKLLPNKQDSLFGCIQIKKQPNEYIDVSWQKKHCRTCNCLLFPLKADNNKLECPICHPDADFSCDTYRIDNSSQTSDVTFVAFDITIPYNTLILLLNDIYENTTDKDMISIICISDRVAFITAFHGLMQLETFSSSSSIKNRVNVFVTREDLKNIIIPSISSIYALFPDSLDNVFDYYDLMKCITKVSVHKPFNIIIYSNRHATPVDADDAKYVSNFIAENRGVVHIGAINEFKRHTAASQESFGTVFSISCAPQCGFIKMIEKNPLTKFRIFAPQQIEFIKVTNSKGSMRMSSRLSKLKLDKFHGGTVQLSFDKERTHSQHVRILEEVKTSDGTFLHLHNFEVADDDNAFNESMNAQAYNTLLLKAFASDIMRSIWNGEKMERLLKRFNSSIKSIIKPNSSLTTIGNDEQLDILRLYYVLCSYGYTDIENRYVCISENDSSYALIVPPAMFVLDEKNACCHEKLWSSFNWPFSIKIVQSKTAFHILAEKYNVKLPDSFTE